MRNKYIFYFPVLILFSNFSCTKTINLDLPETDPRLVVEGIISNDSGPYTVKLTRTQKYSFILDTNKMNYEKGAIVMISDNEGITDTLKEISTGIFQTHKEKITGQAGRSYHIDIFTNDGKHYKSRPEVLLASPEIDSIYFDRDYSDRYEKSFRYNVYIDWNEPKGRINYYMFVVSFFWGSSWHQQYEFNFLMSDNLETGYFYKKMRAVSGYTNGYIILKLDMYTLQKNNFDFWNIMFSQKYNSDISGYVNNTVPLVGNIFNANNPDDYAIGYFQVSGVSSAQVFINR